MPKSAPFSRRPSAPSAHSKAVKLSSKKSKPPGLAPDANDGMLGSGAAEVEFGDLLGTSGEDAISKLVSASKAETTTPVPHLTKKEKQTAKRQALLSRLNPSAGATSHPYALSASSLRRAKRKEKEKLTGGGLGGMADALGALEREAATREDEALERAMDGEPEGEDGEEQDPWKVLEEQEQREKEQGKIGSGKAKGLSAKQRNKALQLESKRLPQILAHPQYAASPWETIRLHAGNTLVKRAAPPPAAGASKKSSKTAMETDRMDF